MNGAADARGALRNLFSLHLGSHAWLPAVFFGYGRARGASRYDNGRPARPGLRDLIVPYGHRLQSNTLLGSGNAERICRRFRNGFESRLTLKSNYPNFGLVALK
jgi:hypothetical protein